MPNSKKRLKLKKTLRKKIKNVRKTPRRRIFRGGMMSFMSMFETPKPQVPQRSISQYNDISDWDREYNQPTTLNNQSVRSTNSTVDVDGQEDDIKNICAQLNIDPAKINITLIADALNNKSAYINGQTVNGWSNLGRQIMLKDAIKYLSDEDKVRFLPILGSKYDKLSMPAHQLVLDARKNIEARFAKR